MATTINSGYANSPKLTANIADHADIYGGRALVFDGVTDYLEIQDTLESVFQASYSISLWLKPDDGQPSSNQSLFGVRTSANSSINNVVRSMITTSGKLFFTYQDGLNDAPAETYNAVFSNGATDWTHVAIVVSESADQIYIYVNGFVQTLHPTYNGDTSALTFRNFGTSNNFPIGGRNNLGTVGEFFSGKMCDFKIFNSALTEAQVQELYKKPENTPNAVQDNLVAWYPMIEGNPESPQSIVYDHSEKKLGSDTFVGLNQWSPKVVDRESVSVSGDELTLTIPTANDAGMSTGNLANLGLSTSLGYAVGDLVKLQFEGKITTNGSGFGETLRWYDTQEYVFSVTNISLTSEYQTFIFYGVISNLGYSIPYLLRMGSRTGTDIYKFKNFSVQKIKMGNHATTNFFGNMADLINESNDSEIWDATNNRFSFTTDGWPGYDDATSLVDDTDWVKTTNIDRAKRKSDADHAFLRKSSGTYEFISHPLTLENGKTYNVSGVYSSSSASSINVEVGASAPSSNSDYTHWATQSLTSSGGTINLDFTAQGTTGHLVIELTGSANENAFLEHIAVREVGISSSGFMPVTNEPVVPQVPLMRYNQKMHFNGHYVYLPSTLTSASNYTLVGWINTLNTGQAHIFQGGSGNDNFQMHSGRVWWYQDGNHYSTTYINDGQTYMIAYQREGNNYSIWVNGIKETSWTQTSYNDYQTFKFSKIGNSVSSRPYKGVINEVSAWNTALSTSEMQELFNDGVALDATTHSKGSDHLLAYYRNNGITTWTDRGNIQAIGFDGADDGIRIPTSFQFALDDYATGAYSIWFYAHDQNPSAVQYVISARDGETNTRLYVQLKSEGLRIAQGDTFSSYVSYSANQWNHILVSWSSGTATFYLNGSQAGQFSFSTASGSNVFDFILGGSYTAGGSFFNGNLGQFALWNTAQDSNISAIYALGRKGSLSDYSNGLQINYLLNPTHSNPDTTGTDKILDRSGNNIHGTQLGGVNFFGTNDGTVAGSPDSITIREGLNSNRDGLGFYFTNPSNNVLRLNGIDEHLKLPYTKSFDMGDGSFTVSAWVKTTLGIGDSQKTILWARDNSDSFKGFEFQIDDSADRPRFVLSDGSGGECNGTTNSVESDKWHFVAVVVDKENDLAKIFLSESDGSALKCQTTTDISSRGNINATPDWYVGKRNGATTQDFMGIIDELMVYNIALTAFESDGTTVEAGDTVTSGELFKNYKFSKGKHKND